MPTILKIFFAALLFSCSTDDSSDSNKKPDKKVSSEDSQKYGTPKNLLEAVANGNAPYAFAFTYDGTLFTLESIKKYEKSSKNLFSKGPHSKDQWTYLLPGNQIEVTLTLSKFKNHFASHWMLEFKNISSSVSKVLKSVQSGSLALRSSEPGGHQVFYNKGSLESFNKTGFDFEPLTKGLGSGEKFTLQPTQGRSSSEIMPYAAVAHPAGVFSNIAVGWSGQWYMDLTKVDASTFVFGVGQKNMTLQLLPGESIRTPSVLHQVVEGDRFTARNNFRKLMKSHFSPNEAKPLSFANAGGLAAFHKLTASQVQTSLTNIVNKGFNFDSFWIDAGWYYTPQDWKYGLGDWSADPTRFPRGMGAIGDSVTAKNMKFTLWYEPERLSSGALNFEILQRDHPSWILRGSQYPKIDGHNPDIFTALNLADEDAFNWILGLIDDRIKKHKVGIYRQDMNVNRLLDFWNERDALVGSGGSLSVELQQRDKLGVQASTGYAVIDGDFDGNGTADLLVLSEASEKTMVQVFKSSKNSIVLTPAAAPLDVGEWIANDDSLQLRTGDINRDGKDDLIRFVNIGGKAVADVLFSSGNTFYRERDQQGIDIGDWMSGASMVDILVMDVNNDGGDDVVRILDRGDGVALADVLFSNNLSFYRPRDAQAVNIGPFSSEGVPIFNLSLDVNGDGRKDLLRLVKAGGGALVDILLSSGTSFGRAKNYSAQPIGAWPSDSMSIYLEATDLDGNGREEFAIISTDLKSRVDVRTFAEAENLRFQALPSSSTAIAENIVERSILVSNFSDITNSEMLLFSPDGGGTLSVFGLSTKSNSIARQGITEAKYIENLYRFWDELKARNPGLVIDSCAAGGRRLDIEAVSRTIALWRSDQEPWNPELDQNKTYGLSDWLPYHGSGTVARPNKQSFEYHSRSGFGSFYNLPLPWTNPNSPFWNWAKTELDAWHQTKDLYSKDFFPLAIEAEPHSGAFLLRNDIWMGWQNQNYEQTEGVIQVFRRSSSTQSKKMVKPVALKGNTNYRFYTLGSTDLDLTINGTQAMNVGLEVTIPSAMSAVIIKYEVAN